MSASRRGNRSRGYEAAYGPRNKRRAALRHKAFRVLSIVGRRPTGALPDYVEFFPPVRDVQEFSDLSTRVSCYLGDVDLPLYLPTPRFDLDPASVPYMQPELVRDPGWVQSRPDGRPYLVIHKVTPASLTRLATHKTGRASVVDPDLFGDSEMEYWRVRERLAWPNYPSADMSLQRLRDSHLGAKQAYVLATGPSALTVDLKTIDAEVRITCNSSVRDLERIRAFQPTIIAFNDPVFHFGPSRYAATFRKDLLNAVDACDPILLCGTDWVSPLLTVLPELRSRLAVIPIVRGGPWRWPTDQNPTTRTTGSVLTNLMLPVALMLADHVSVAGVDGRQPTENYFWTHGIQYSDELMGTVFDAHPAFFRDRNYVEYYDEYCNDLESLIQKAESRGRTVIGAAPSWIPAFRRRGAEEPSIA